MHPIDRVVLEHCQEGFQSVALLKGQIPAGTLYRHVGRLVTLGWLEKRGRLYRTTAAGRRQVAAAVGERSWTAHGGARPGDRAGRAIIDRQAVT